MTSALILALVPIALLIMLGLWLRHANFVGEAFWPYAEKLGYYVLLPALFFHSLATAQLGDLPVQAMPLVVLATTPLL